MEDINYRVHHLAMVATDDHLAMVYDLAMVATDDFTNWRWWLRNVKFGVVQLDRLGELHGRMREAQVILPDGCREFLL